MEQTNFKKHLQTMNEIIIDFVNNKNGFKLLEYKEENMEKNIQEMEDKLKLLDDIIQNKSKDLWKFINEPKNLLIIEDIINNNKNNKIKLLYNRLLNPVQSKFGENISDLNQEFIEKQLLEWSRIDMICNQKLYKDMNDDNYQLFLIFYYFYILFTISTKTSKIFYLNCFILNYLKKNPKPSITLFDETDTDKKLKDSKYKDELENNKALTVEEFINHG